VTPEIDLGLLSGLGLPNECCKRFLRINTKKMGTGNPSEERDEREIHFVGSQTATTSSMPFPRSLSMLPFFSSVRSDHSVLSIRVRRAEKEKGGGGR
jgi:hypothetical protein